MFTKGRHELHIFAELIEQGQALVRPVRERDGQRHALLDPGMGRQRLLDLPRFYPEPADLYLIVRSPCEFKVAVRKPSCEVPAPIHFRSAKRMIDKA